MTRQRLLKIEFAHAVSHGLGIVMTLAFAPILFVKASNIDIPLLPWALSGYVFGLIAVFSFSTLYHATIDPAIKYALKILDHISIYFLIGGTYFPFVLLHADPKRALWLLSIQWLVILIGIVNKIFFIGKFKLLSLLTYLGLGFMIVGMGNEFWQSLPQNALYCLAAGGFTYAFGTIFYSFEKIKYNHLIWHFFVLAAAMMHFAGIYLAM